MNYQNTGGSNNPLGTTNQLIQDITSLIENGKNMSTGKKLATLASVAVGVVTLYALFRGLTKR